MTDADDRERSEWGKLNEGQRYGILAVDVDRALSRADLGKHEQALMQYVRERSWGTATSRKGGKGNAWPDPIEVRWRLAEIAEETGLPETRLCEARASLLNSRMLIEERGCIRINKNADEWLWPARPASRGRQEQPAFPRLDEAAMRYALAGRTRREQIGVGESVTLERNASTEVITPERKEITAERKKITPERKEITAERNSPHKERASEDFKTLDLKTSRDDDAPPQFDPKANSDEPKYHPGNTLADVRAVEEWCKSLPKGVGLQQGIDYKISVWAKDYPIGWIHEALRDAYANDARKMSTYVHHLLREWKDAGGPDAAREKHRKAKARPTGAALPTEVWVPPNTPYLPMIPAFKVAEVKKKNPGMTDEQAVDLIREQIRSRRSA